ncbi:hypothetical protein [Rubrobacter xylanophilus]|uniref:hypothetical protein n=1 Tax=Rubrobacter xylanophilus TaxID=49319 RepID=UPI001C63EAE4|nr:hypothetical protein [Rubrobacter xylanophilus]
MLAGGYPVGLWWPPPTERTNAYRYREISEAGFNFVIGGNGVTNDETNPAALDAAAECGLSFVLTDGRLQRLILNAAPEGQRAGDGVRSPMRVLSGPDRPGALHRSAPSPGEAVRLRLLALLKRYGSHPALAGINLFDEPHRQLFGLLSGARGILQEAGAGLLPYINVWPSYASLHALGTGSYERYLELYLSVVRPPVLSFDHYPLLSGGGITGDYFYNWAVIRRFSLRAGIPTWVFIQSVGFEGRAVGLAPRRTPDGPELLWQVNVALAYGAKGIQYFTYWTPENTPTSPVRFGSALVSRDGRRTPLYGHARDVNSYLKSVGRVLLPLVSESVVHAGERRLPRGASGFRRDGWLHSVAGSPVILGRFRRPGHRNVRYLLVVNRSSSRAAKVSLELPSRVARAYAFDRARRRFVRLRPLRRRGRLRPGMRLRPGAARLLLLRAR